MRSERVLLIDIGNTNLKWSLLTNGQLSAVSSISHKNAIPAQLADGCWSDIALPERIYLANVASDELGQGLTAWMKATWGKSPSIVCSVAKSQGVSNGYINPSQLGVDRWLTLLAVRSTEPGPVCVVDCGTAITIDLMGADGQHQGGMILPGLNLMRESLLRDTKIPRVTHVVVDALFARDTAAAVASAALHSAAALIERSMQDAVSNKFGEPLLIVTGSDAGIISSALRIPYKIDSGLVMKGLALIASSRAIDE